MKSVCQRVKADLSAIAFACNKLCLAGRKYPRSGGKGANTPFACKEGKWSGTMVTTVLEKTIDERCGLFDYCIEFLV